MNRLEEDPASVGRFRLQGTCYNLKNCVFSGLSQAELSKVAQVLQVIQCNRRAEQTDIPAIPGYYIVCRGKGAVVTMIPEGRQIVTQILKGGDSLMISPYRSRERPYTFLRAYGEATIGFIPEKDFLELQKAYPSIVIRAFEKAEHQARLLRERLIETVYAGSRARVAMLILELEESSLLKEIRFRQGELAEMAGISREMCNRRLREFSERGLITLRGHGIAVLDPEGLRQVGKR